MRTLALAVAVLVVSVGLGCTGSAPSNTVDSGGGVCAKVLYDPCVDEHNCTAGACRTFTNGGSSLEVCTQSCGSGSACPDDSTGAPGTCDPDLMLCRPAKANNCTPSLD